MNRDPIDDRSRRAGTLQDYQERVLVVLVHIQQHLDEAISLDALADIACFSPFHFHRVFRGLVGEGVMEHVRRLRLERSAFQLKTTDRPVTRIAFDAGYETHESYTRAFSAMFGQSPSGYRKAHDLIRPPTAPSGVHFDENASAGGFKPVKGDATVDIRIETIPEIRVAFVRHVGPYAEVGAAWQRLCSWAWPKGLLGPQSKMIGLCHDDPDVTPSDKIRYDACITVGPDVKPEGDIGVQVVDGGQFVVATHKGAYANLGKTYAEICGQWAPRNGRQLGPAPSIERYLNNPQMTPEADLLTEVCVRLA